MEKLLKNLLVKRNFIDDQTCDFIVEYARNQTYQELEVFDPNKTNESNEVSWKQDKKVRNTQTVELDDIQPLIQSILKTAVIDVINPFIAEHGVQIKDAEGVQLLRYGSGGHYKPHMDGEAIFNNHGTFEWRKSVDRDVSLVMYLNEPDDFVGGDLELPNFGLRIPPRKGQLVCFPSSHEFLHGVHPVTSGERFALVTWMRVIDIKDIKS